MDAQLDNYWQPESRVFTFDLDMRHRTVTCRKKVPSGTEQRYLERPRSHRKELGRLAHKLRYMSWPVS